ncbi:hypothetical protein BGZ65_006664, partial [Modicella reniformis]
MTSLPTFSSSCVAPSGSGQTVFLFGVPSPGRLEAHSINLSDPLAPISTLISATTSTTAKNWDAQYDLGCYAYLGDNPSANSPINVIQFRSTVQALFYPNGTWVTNIGSTAATDVDYVSPKYFSTVGSTNGWNWFLAKTTPPESGGGSTGAWRDIRMDNTVRLGPKDQTVLGSEDPLLTVGAIAQDINNFGNGLLFSFEQSGLAGMVFRTTGNKRPELNLTATESLVTLTKANAVGMNSIKLSSEAMTVPSASAALILDKSSGGTISVFSIDPRASAYKLVQSSVKNSSPLFLSKQSATALNSKIVVYGGLLQDGSGTSNTIHVFDVISGTWFGPDLVDPSSSKQATSGGMSTGVITWIVAAAVVILIAVVSIVVWRIRRNKQYLKSDRVQQGSDGTTDKATMIKLMNIERNHSHEGSSITLTDTSPTTKAAT